MSPIRRLILGETFEYELINEPLLRERLRFEILFSAEVSFLIPIHFSFLLKTGNSIFCICSSVLFSIFAR